MANKTKRMLTQQEFENKVKVWALIVPLIVCVLTSAATLAGAYLARRAAATTANFTPTLEDLQSFRTIQERLATDRQTPSGDSTTQTTNFEVFPEASGVIAEPRQRAGSPQVKVVIRDEKGERKEIIINGELIGVVQVPGTSSEAESFSNHLHLEMRDIKPLGYSRLSSIAMFLRSASTRQIILFSAVVLLAFLGLYLFSRRLVIRFLKQRYGIAD